MPIVRAEGKSIDCSIGANLRQVLLEHEVALHNGGSKIINCHSIGPAEPVRWRYQAMCSH